MTDYVPPRGDIAFALETFGGRGEIAELEPFKHADRETVDALLDEAGRFMAEVVAPTNAVGDTEGSRWHDGEVTTPTGFAEAYERYVEAGWGGVAFDPEYGGGGFPWVVGVALQELVTSANMAFSMCPLLTQGAIDMLSHHGSEEQKRRYLPRMITGEWTGTMNLTESEAGSDVGALRTRAVPAGDGTWRIHGTKIFTSFGEHDMAENIVHLVLARTPDAPPGTKGISCFIVPKHLVAADGTLGARNDLRCVSIEHKMGIKASPTCVLSYGDHDGAVGELIGDENAGMAYMFTMMNNARLSVGLEGLSLAERAWQDAVAYAQQRVQGRAPGAARGVSSPIVDHPDVRRMLFTMKSLVEAMRALIYTTAGAIDVAAHDPDEAVRAEHRELVDLLIPLAKAWSTDMGSVVTSLAIQVHGGMGYIEETGVAQHYRDARITSIYEGTNGIQAMDLVGRKLALRGGGVVADHLDRVAAVVAALGEVDASHGLGASEGALARALAATRSATEWILEHDADPRDALAAATPYLRMMAVTTAGWLMARQALVGVEVLESGAAVGGMEHAAAPAHLETARFFCEQLVPEVEGLLPAVRAGGAALYRSEPAGWGP